MPAGLNLEAAAIRYRADGVTVLRGVFAEWVETLRAGVERNLRAPGPHVRRYTPPGQSGYFFGDYCNWQRIEEYRRFVERSNLGAVAAAMMGSRRAVFFHEHVLVKEPGTGEPTPWHHDYPYYSVDCDQSVSLWIALWMQCRRTCARSSFAGSHRWGKWYVPDPVYRAGMATRSGARPGRTVRRRRGRRGAGAHPRHRERPRAELRYHAASSSSRGMRWSFDFLTVHGAPPNPSPPIAGAARLRLGYSATNARWADSLGAHLAAVSRAGGANHAPRTAFGGRNGPEFPVIYG